MADEKPNPNRTVFQPSPLQQRAATQPEPPVAPQPAPTGADPSGFAPPAPDAAITPPSAAAPPPPQAPRPRLRDDIPRPPVETTHRNPLMAKAGPLLALLASIRTGRAQISLPDLHRRAAQQIDEFQAAFQGKISDEHLRRSIFALCATADDIALNLPLPQAEIAQWAQRSLMYRSFQGTIGGDQFWRLLDEMIARPAEFQHLLELYHACMAAGFEGRYRVERENGRHAHQVMMQRVFQALQLSRTLSHDELSPHWEGEDIPAGRVGLWGPLAIAAAAAVGLLIAIWLGLYAYLQWHGQAAKDALARINDVDNHPTMTMNRPATAPPPDSNVANTVSQFLKDERAQGLVEVTPTTTGVKIATTDKTLAFESGSDEITDARKPLFDKIAQALKTQAGAIRVEGHTDSQPPSALGPFRDNQQLSEARAAKVADRIRNELRDSTRTVTSRGFGATIPKDTNATPQGRARNRRVEIFLDGPSS